MILLFGYCQDLIGVGDGAHPPLLTCLDGFLEYINLMSYFPFLAKLLQNLPTIISRRIFPELVEFREVCPIDFTRTTDLD